MRRQELLYAMTGARGIRGGIASANLNVLPALIDLARERNTGLTVLSLLEKEEHRPEFVPDWVRFVGFRGKKFRFAVSLLIAVRRRPIFCFDHVTLALPVLPLAAAGVVKTIIFAHGSESWKRVRRGSRWSFQCASLCLANSHFTLAKMRERLSRFNGEACPLGLSPEIPLNGKVPEPLEGTIELTAADGERRTLKSQVLLLVARMDRKEREKGHRELIDVMPELLKEYPNVQLVFPGPGDDRENLRELARRKGVASSVFLPGLVSGEILQCLYRHCYAYVMASRQEGFGLAYLEAMNYAKPCVGCFDQGAEDVVVDGETGLLVRNPEDKEELLGVLQALLSNRGMARSMGRKGFDRLHKNFTPSHYQERIRQQIVGVL